MADGCGGDAQDEAGKDVENNSSCILGSKSVFAYMKDVVDRDVDEEDDGRRYDAQKNEKNEYAS